MRSTHRPFLVLAFAALFAVGTAGCGSDGDDAAATSTPSSTSASGSTTRGEASTTTSGAPSSTTTTVGGPTTTIAEADLPGERIEIYPYEGAALGVVGVEADDTLNLRVGPGTAFGVVVELAPLADGIVATGHNRTVDDGFWVQATVDGTTGWANGAYLSQPAGTTDITDELEPVGGATLEELARAVAAQRASVEPRSDVVIVAGPAGGDDAGEITVDVLGLGDDALRGERLHLEATRGDAGQFVADRVEATALCARGVAGDRCT